MGDDGWGLTMRILLILLLFLALARSVQATTLVVTYRVKTPFAKTPISRVKITPPVPRTATARGSLENIVCKVFGEDCAMALAIAKAESHLRPDAVGDGHITYWQDGVKYGMSCGMFQVRVLPGRPSCEQLQDPEFNARYAYRLFKSSGWFPWSVYTNGSYLAYYDPR